MKSGYLKSQPLAIDNPMKIKNIAVLGSTGSIGLNTLDVIRDNPDKFRVTALSASRNLDVLEKQAREFRPLVVALHHPEPAEELKRRLGGAGVEVVSGVQGACHVSALPETDMVVMAISGSAGLMPAFSAIRAGKDLALATKEVLVMAGGLLMKEAEDRCSVIPIDSEHNAIFQAMAGARMEDVKNIILTASGGPFYGFDDDELANASLQQALNHPNWDMGRKISIDCATLMNKGLEVIAAKWLFGMKAENIKVLIHPQSIVHSMVEFVDGSVIAQLGMPDMRIPISYALYYPGRLPNRLPPLNLAEVGALTFKEPDTERFPCLKYAYRALEEGGTMVPSMNAANETAVQAFLDNKLVFNDIPKVVVEVMERHENREADVLEQVLEADGWARAEARGIIENYSGR